MSRRSSTTAQDDDCTRESHHLVRTCSGHHTCIFLIPLIYIRLNGTLIVTSSCSLSARYEGTGACVAASFGGRRRDSLARRLTHAHAQFGPGAPTPGRRPRRAPRHGSQPVPLARRARRRKTRLRLRPPRWAESRRCLLLTQRMSARQGQARSVPMPFDINDQLNTLS